MILLAGTRYGEVPYAGRHACQRFDDPVGGIPPRPGLVTLRQAVGIVREAAVKFKGDFEPWVVLVFDEKYWLKGILRLRDIFLGLEPWLRTEAPPDARPVASTAS